VLAQQVAGAVVAVERLQRRQPPRREADRVPRLPAVPGPHDRRTGPQGVTDRGERGRCDVGHVPQRDQHGVIHRPMRDAIGQTRAHAASRPRAHHHFGAVRAQQRGQLVAPLAYHGDDRSAAQPLQCRLQAPERFEHDECSVWQ